MQGNELKGLLRGEGVQVVLGEELQEELAAEELQEELAGEELQEELAGEELQEELPDEHQEDEQQYEEHHVEDVKPPPIFLSISLNYFNLISIHPSQIRTCAALSG